MSLAQHDLCLLFKTGVNMEKVLRLEGEITDDIGNIKQMLQE